MNQMGNDVLERRILDQKTSSGLLEQYLDNIISDIAAGNKLSLKLSPNYQSLVKGFKDRVFELEQREQYKIFGNDLTEILLAEIEMILETNSETGIWLIDRIEWN